MKSNYLFNRVEFAGALGDLGTLLPLAIGLILISGLSPAGLFLSVGLFYILSRCRRGSNHFDQLLQFSFLFSVSNCDINLNQNNILLAIFQPPKSFEYYNSYKYSCPKDEMYYIKWVLFIFRGPI